MKLLSPLLALALTVSIGTLVAAPRNIVLVITDNQNAADLGCYGNPVVKTPHLDALAAEGMRFRQAFATVASCSASRAVIYTGVLTHRNGQYAHTPAEHNQRLRDDVPTVFEKLVAAGYRNALIGKTHIAPMEKYPLHFESKAESKNVVAMAKEAEAFVTEKDERPFFLAYCLGDPHPNGRDGVAWGTPLKQSPGYEPTVYDPAEVIVPGFLPDTKEVREQLAGYYGQITRADHGAGLLFEALRRHGRWEDMLVLFLSDHGTSEPGAMGTQYEPGVHAPLIVRCPGKPAGLVSEALVAFTDLTPTMLDWAGVADPAKDTHGRSLLPILGETNPTGWDEVVLSHVAHEIYSYYPMRTLRERRYKLIWNLTWGAEFPVPVDTFQRRLWAGIRERGDKMIGPRTVEQFLHRPKLELYDLETDPWEVENLAAKTEHAERVKAMSERLVKHLEETEDPWLIKYRPEW